MVRVEVNPELLRWARDRAGVQSAVLEKRFPQLGDWERGSVKPTLRQLEKYAKATRIAVGFLFLARPPIEVLPLPDFRTMRDEGVDRPSPELLDTIYICQQRQEWFRQYLVSRESDPLPFVGSATTRDAVVEAAGRIRKELGFDLDARQRMRTWAEALSEFADQADEAGVLVMRNSVVGNNNNRPLDPQEFRGFAICDKLAPLVFLNAADTKSAQMFTLAHELAHIWVGESGISDADVATIPTGSLERWCNQVAAEVLVPIGLVRSEYRAGSDLDAEMGRLARRFKVSTLVVLRRIHDAGAISREVFWEAYELELARLLSLDRKRKADSAGGNFYATQLSRVGERFARALVARTLEGQTLQREAMQLLGFPSSRTFNRLVELIGANP